MASLEHVERNLLQTVWQMSQRPVHWSRLTRQQLKQQPQPNLKQVKQMIGYTLKDQYNVEYNALLDELNRTI